MPEDFATANANPIRRRSIAPGSRPRTHPRQRRWRRGIFGAVRPTEGGFLPLFWPSAAPPAAPMRWRIGCWRLGGVLSMPGRQVPKPTMRMTASQYNWLIRRMNESDGGQPMRGDGRPGGRRQLRRPGREDQIAAIRRICSTRWKAATAAALDEFPDPTARHARPRCALCWAAARRLKWRPHDDHGDHEPHCLHRRRHQHGLCVPVPHLRGDRSGSLPRPTCCKPRLQRHWRRPQRHGELRRGPAPAWRC